MKQQYPLEQAKELAEELKQQLSRMTSRIEIAGSVRRCKETVGDIEIVCQPSETFDLFGAAEPQPIYLPYRAVKDGSRYKQYRLPNGLCLDLFIVLPPAQWGVILALRTGPMMFSKKLVTRRPWGYLPSEYHVEDGAVWHEERGVIATPEESDYFRLCGLNWIPPQERN